VRLGTVSKDDEQAHDFVLSLALDDEASTLDGDAKVPTEDNQNDFDMALDTIFKVFGEDVEAVEQQRAQEIYNNLSVEEQSIVQNKSVFQVHPTVVKNDFRLCFPRMYMNTLNSGDFDMVQDYYHTFMTSSTNFVAVHNNLNPSFGIPEVVRVTGPQLTIHYLLGVSVMYPDMVMQMRDTRITTSNAWKGSRIEMDVEFLSTKMYHLPVDEWLPPVSALQYKYQGLGKKQRLLDVQDVLSPASFRQLQLAEVPSPEPSSMLGISPQRIPSVGYTPDTSPTVRNKRKTSDLDSISTISSESSHGAAYSPFCARQPRVPTEYIHALQAQARLLPKAMQLHTKGKITMFLDENNYIQHMNLTVGPG